jgi:hypothetical protein
MTEFRLLTVSALACAALGLAAPAMAQTTDTTTGSDSSTSAATTSTDSGSMGQMASRNAGDVTCADMAGMENAVMERTLYYIAGYQRAESDSLNLSDSVSTSSSGAAGGTDSTDTAGGVATGSDTTMGEGTADAGSVSPSDSGSVGGVNDGTQIDGFFAIPVAQIVVKCDEDPSRQVYDVLDEERSMGGASNN